MSFGKTGVIYDTALFEAIGQIKKDSEVRRVVKEEILSEMGVASVQQLSPFRRRELEETIDRVVRKMEEQEINLQEDDLQEVSQKLAIKAYRERAQQANDDDEDSGHYKAKAEKTLARIEKKYGKKGTEAAQRASSSDGSVRKMRGGKDRYSPTASGIGDYLQAKEKVVAKMKSPTTKKGQEQRKNYMKMNKGKLADKDYDKDGKIETSKDEVMGSRMRAAKMAGKMKDDDKTPPFTPDKKTVERGPGGPKSSAKWLAQAAKRRMMTKEEVEQQMNEARGYRGLTRKDVHKIARQHYGDEVPGYAHTYAKRLEKHITEGGKISSSIDRHRVANGGVTPDARDVSGPDHNFLKSVHTEVKRRMKINEEYEQQMNEAKHPAQKNIEKHLKGLYGPGKVTIEPVPGRPRHFSATHEAPDGETNSHMVRPGKKPTSHIIDDSPHVSSSYHGEEVVKEGFFKQREIKNQDAERDRVRGTWEGGKEPYTPSDRDPRVDRVARSAREYEKTQPAHRRGRLPPDLE